ncbi:MAG TPA: nuclear transport factor 2 family protein [Burkholderiales bacterium]|nr:nuclear transport factor 2 family protein [Burkholderiales bacterium]
MKIFEKAVRAVPVLAMVLSVVSSNAATLNQTVQFMAVTPDALYDAFLSSADHAAMTMDGTHPSTFYRPSVGNVSRGQEGDDLRAVGLKGPDGKLQYAVQAKILKLVPGKLIVMSWKNWVWKLAVNPADVTDFESTVVLTFRKNVAGAEVQLVQANVPDYTVRIPDPEETGPLSSLVNAHWSLVYWEPMKRYFQGKTQRRSNARETLEKFYAAVVKRDFAAARRRLTDDLLFIGLFKTYRNADDYVADLTQLMQMTVRLDVKKIVVQGNDAVIFYELETKAPAAATTLVAEWHQIKNGKIARAQSAFDGRAFEAMFGGAKR